QQQNRLSLSFSTPPTSELYTLSLHDALPISAAERSTPRWMCGSCGWRSEPATDGLIIRRPRARKSDFIARSRPKFWPVVAGPIRSEEHTSELQSLRHLVCRLLLETKKKK